MPELKVITYQSESMEYELALSWDEEALIEGEITFEASAARWPANEPNQREQVAASISIQHDEEENALLLVRIGEYTAPPVFLADLYGDEWIEGVLETIPVWVIPADPITVCLIRSGVSTGVGQVIECKNGSEGEAWFRPRVRAIGRCLRENIVGMGMKMAFRCGRCVAQAGL